MPTHFCGLSLPRVPGCCSSAAEMAIRPVYRPKIVKKRTKRFIRHQSDRYHKLRTNWRKPKGAYFNITLTSRQRARPSINFPQTPFRSRFSLRWSQNTSVLASKFASRVTCDRVYHLSICTHELTF